MISFYTLLVAVAVRSRKLISYPTISRKKPNFRYDSLKSFPQLEIQWASSIAINPNLSY
jgi:hypothetical protein